MQRTLIATVAAAALLTLAGTAQAQTDDLNSYAEVGYSKVTIKVDDIGLKTAPAVLSSVLGYWINPNLAVEAHLGLAMGSDDITDNGMSSGAKAKLGTNIGLFLRPSVEVSDGLELFGRVGWQRSRLKITASNESAYGSGNDLAFGFGANYHLSKTSYLQLSWLNHFSKDGLSAKGVGLSYGYRF